MSHRHGIGWRLLNLGFREITEERFDLIVPKDRYFTKSVQTLLAMLNSSALKERAEALGGSDVRETGKIVFP